jgi:hypothetical protein
MNRLIKKEVRTPPQQIYVPNKKVPAAPMERIKQKSLIIGSTEVSNEEIKELIVIESHTQSTMQKVE